MTYKTERDFDTLYTSTDDPQIPKDNQIADKRIHAFVDKRKQNKTYMTDIQVLREALDDYEKLIADYLYGSKASAYFAIQTMLTQDENIKALSNKAQHHARDLMINLEFFELDIGNIKKEQQTEILQAKELQPYQHFLERIFLTAKHQLSEPEERIISKLSKNAYSNRTSMVEDFFAKEEYTITNKEQKQETKTLEELLSLCASVDKKTRDQAGQAIHTITGRNADVAEKELNSVLVSCFCSLLVIVYSSLAKKSSTILVRLE
jgi:oligoendopeptidase F